MAIVNETNYALAGNLHIESGGQTIVPTAGDTVTVTAGSVGPY
jgi:ethanolamine utilization protein EutQ (cupin superfamily)